ncbi:hypothetical protein Hanom_Chr06g00556531 [Helianthus anomalus]
MGFVITGDRFCKWFLVVPASCRWCPVVPIDLLAVMMMAWQGWWRVVFEPATPLLQQ